MERNELRFFLSTQHRCGYLSDQDSSNLVVDPALELNGGVYSVLSTHGFRRSGEQIYRPHCRQCQACVPIRVVVDAFIPSKSQRRCLNKNKDLRAFKVSNIDSDEYYALYERYICERHGDGEMYPPSREQFRDFLRPAWGITDYLVFRDTHDHLVSVAVCDKLHDGLSAMYSYYDPSLPKRSLGAFNILYQILWAKDHGLPYLYMGYWIAESPKMSYKTQYRPYELLKNNQWISG